MHVVAPLRLNCPAAQGACVELVEPGGQKYPAAHGPSHKELTWPPVDPYRPAWQTPVQLGFSRPLEEPYNPGAHSVHDIATR